MRRANTIGGQRVRLDDLDPQIRLLVLRGGVRRCGRPGCWCGDRRPSRMTRLVLFALIIAAGALFASWLVDKAV